MKKTGYIFVVPNFANPVDWDASRLAADNSRTYLLEQNQQDYNALEGTCPPCEMTIGYLLKNGKRCEYTYPAQWLQVWAADMPERRIGDMDEVAKTSSNFKCHGFWLDGEYQRHGFPEYLPAAIFAGKKEGDIVSFKFRGIEFELELAQKKGRYARFGNFEDVVKNVTLM